MKTTTLKGLISNNNPYGINGITIPQIQRAYAQGRSDAHAVKTRDRFLSAIHDGLLNNGLTLDFIYGNVQDGQLIPLDGQQRLTTLWLLHWYASRKEGINNNNLERFSYNTRYSARDFLTKLISYQPKLDIVLSCQIRNQGWFPMDWINDPTVSGMLTMLDEIQRRFNDIEDLWNKLDKIDFYFRDIKEMQLTDDIYIKMNSRGKPLTDFEHFKAEFLKVIRTSNQDETGAKRIGLKIDREWTDLLWDFRDDRNLVDEGFLNLFRMISLILIYKADQSASEYDIMDDFNLLERVYKNKSENVMFFENALDCLIKVKNRQQQINSASNNRLEDFFASYLSNAEYQKGKVVVPQQISNINILQSIIEGKVLRKNEPTLYWLVMLFSFLLYLMNTSEIEDNDFRRRLRVVVNLLKNSRNEVVDNPKGDAGNRMPANIKQVENIILTGEIAETIMIDGEQRPNFNALQMDEERHKLLFTNNRPDEANGLFQLEDYHLIEGRTEIVGYENTHLYQRFISLFDTCSYDQIDCAMLAINDYSQRLNYWCVQLGSGDEEGVGNRAWYSLFHPSGRNTDFEKTKQSLRTLLERSNKLDDTSLNEIAQSYIEECRDKKLFDWRYYYICYDCFRPDRYGKYTKLQNEPYRMVALHAEKRESSNAYQCMLMALLEEGAMPSTSDWNDIRALTYRKGGLTCDNGAFVSYTLSNDNIRAQFDIPQNDNGIDTVDRIQYFKENRRDESYWSNESNE